MKNTTNILKVLTHLFSGYSFRTKVQHDPSGDAYVIQMKDMWDNYTKINSRLSRIKSSTINPGFYLRNGDVLLVAKGANNFAVVYDLDLPRAIAASAFFVLRPDVQKIYPAYLAWYINQKPVQQYLKENMAGSYVPNINKSTVEGIEITLPSLQKQKAIASVQQLLNKEHQLMQDLAARRIQLIQNLLLAKAYDE